MFQNVIGCFKCIETWSFSQPQIPATVQMEVLVWYWQGHACVQLEHLEHVVKDVSIILSIEGFLH